MARQPLLFGSSDLDVVKEDVALTEIRLLTWNISNSSIERAYRQFEWLLKTKANIIILTEAKYSKGSLYIKEGLENLGFNVFFQQPPRKEYGVIIAEKGFDGKKWELELPFLPHRLESIILGTFLGRLKLIGIYVPSRGTKERRNVNKRKFQDQIIELLRFLSREKEISNLVLGGDLNVIEPDHVPYYSFFGNWEYEFYLSFIKIGLIDAYKLLNLKKQEFSWIGRYKDGYRFDHLFVAKNISPLVKKCGYIHHPRVSRLSDHSAMHMKITDKISAVR